MGRSVSYATGSKHIAYSHLSIDTYYCSHCGETFNEYDTRDAQPGEYGYDSGQPSEEQAAVDCCPHCKAHEDDCSTQDQQSEWDYHVDDFRSMMKQAFPSLEDCDEWVGREDHALLCNRHCYIGVSEYCGLVSMWVKPKDDDWRDDDKAGLRDRWIDQIERKFYTTANQCFGTALRKLGHFSNGEGVYERIAA
jgi:hypothetical protein